MRRLILTLTCSLALVLTIGFGVSAASNGQGFGALHLGSKAATITTGSRAAESTDNGDGTDTSEKKTFTATTFEYDPGHTGTVAAAWVKHLGLPQNDPNRYGLILSKNTVSATNASAGLVINSVKGIHLTELGFDVRNSGHCGAGAPRFNVVASDMPNMTRFYGCVYGTHSPSTPQAGWQRVRFLTSVSYPGAAAIPATATILSISVVFDEGVEVAPDNSGLVVLDNIDINGFLIGGPTAGDSASGQNNGRGDN
jgi:hypothetical protein